MKKLFILISSFFILPSAFAARITGDMRLVLGDDAGSTIVNVSCLDVPVTFNGQTFFSFTESTQLTNGQLDVTITPPGRANLSFFGKSTSLRIVVPANTNTYDISQLLTNTMVFVQRGISGLVLPGTGIQIITNNPGLFETILINSTAAGGTATNAFQTAAGNSLVLIVTNLTDFTYTVFGVSQTNNQLVSWALIAPSSKENQSANLDAWSALATSAKQDHSANLDLWSAVVPSSYQPILGYVPMRASANLTNWSNWTIDGVTIVQSGGILSAATGGSGNVTGDTSSTDLEIPLFNGITGKAIKRSGHFLGDYQLALGFTPLTFTQTSNLINSMTIPLDALAVPGLVTGAGVDQNTNVVTLFFRNNLTVTGTGTNGFYYVDASGSGGGGGGSVNGMVSSNYFVTSTNLFVWDLAKVQKLTLCFETNLTTLQISNSWFATNEECQLGTYNDTNGGWRIGNLITLGGYTITNSNAQWRGTNASQHDEAVVRVDGFGTNLLFAWTTNLQPPLPFTNSLTGGGGGGGGGGTWTLIATVSTNALLSAHQTITSPATNTTGGNLIVAGVEWYNNAGPIPYDNQNNNYTNALLTAYGDASGNHSNQIYFAISPTVNAAHTFSLTNTTAGQMFCGITVQVWLKSGGTPAFDTATGTNYVSGGGNTTSLNTGTNATFGANEIVISSATWNGSGVTATSVTPGFTITDQKTLGDPTATGGIAYTNMAAQATVNPVWNFSGNANALSGSTASFK